MRIQLFDKDDIKDIFGDKETVKPIEDMMVRAFVRALRIVAKEGEVLGFKAPAAEAMPAAPAAPAEPAAAAVAAAPPTVEQVWGPRHIHPQPPRVLPRGPFNPALPPDKRGDLPAPRGVVVERRPIETPPRQRRALVDLLKHVDDAPPGYIPRERAVELLGGTEADKIALSQWLLASEVHAVIAHHGFSGPPHKGCRGGRVYVHKGVLLARHQHRQQQAAASPWQRKGFVRPDLDEAEPPRQERTNGVAVDEPQPPRVLPPLGI